MKWVKVAIGAVIAIISIGIIATSVYDMTQEKVREEVVTFEVLTVDGISGDITSGAYSQIINYSVFESSTSTNLISMEYNDTIYTNVSIGSFTIYIDIEWNDYLLVIGVDDTFEDAYGTMDVQLNDTVKLTFEVTQPAQLTGVSATLILLTPLIFAGGVLAYLLNKQNY